MGIKAGGGRVYRKLGIGPITFWSESVNQPSLATSSLATVNARSPLQTQAAASFQCDELLAHRRRFKVQFLYGGQHSVLLPALCSLHWKHSARVSVHYAFPIVVTSRLWSRCRWGATSVVGNAMQHYWLGMLCVKVHGRDVM